MLVYFIKSSKRTIKLLAAEENGAQPYSGFESAGTEEDAGIKTVTGGVAAGKPSHKTFSKLASSLGNLHESPHGSAFNTINQKISQDIHFIKRILKHMKKLTITPPLQVTGGKSRRGRREKKLLLKSVRSVYKDHYTNLVESAENILYERFPTKD